MCWCVNFVCDIVLALLKWVFLGVVCHRKGDCGVSLEWVTNGSYRLKPFG